MFQDLKTKLIRLWKSKRLNNIDFYKVPHPSFFVKKIFIKKHNFKFDTSYKISSDLDFIINCFKKSLDYEYVNDVFVTQRSGGTSQKLVNIIKANYEVYQICKKRKIQYKFLFILKKILFKLCQLK